MHYDCVSLVWPFEELGVLLGKSTLEVDQFAPNNFYALVSVIEVGATPPLKSAVARLALSKTIGWPQ